MPSVEIDGSVVAGLAVSTALPESSERCSMPDQLISVDELDALLGSPTLRVLDVRWRLDRPDGRPEYLAGHIPGAVYVDLDTELAKHGAPSDGRHPLPDVTDLQRAARRWGIHDGDTVVVYDDLKNLSSARAWWLLRYAGIPDVRVLDGSLRAWTDSARALEKGDVVPSPGTVTLSYGKLPVLDIDEVAALPASGILLDARAGERYRGEVEPVDPRAGHIPGAVSAPTTENVDEDGRFLPAATLRARFDALGVRDDTAVGVYCGSGVTASHDALALTLAGFTPALYPGSWSQWSNSPGRPVAVGPNPR
jgi:thiosulfate/3-mercaptopyruvate sulfurtransferase